MNRERIDEINRMLQNRETLWHKIMWKINKDQVEKKRKEALQKNFLNNIRGGSGNEKINKSAVGNSFNVIIKHAGINIQE